MTSREVMGGGLRFEMVQEVHCLNLDGMTTLPPLTLARNALARNDFDAALHILEAAVSRTRSSRERARLDLEAAGVHVLYGREGVESGMACLDDALLRDPRLDTEPLFLALRASLGAFAVQENGEEQGPAEQAEQLRILALAAREGSPEARFHAGVALVNLGESGLALEFLQSIYQNDLPEFLRWRVHSWAGQAFEQLGHSREAAKAYAAGSRLAQGVDRASLLIDEAAMLLELDEPSVALERLQAAQLATGQDESPLERSSRLYLEARVQLALENPSLALDRIDEARRLELENGDLSYGTSLVFGQVLAALGDWKRAIEVLKEAQSLALPQDKAFVAHELGLAQMDSEVLEEACLSLERAAGDEAYPYRAEAKADLAEVWYRLGQYAEAERVALEALELGAVVPASLTLANIAYEYYRLDEALGHYERVLREAIRGSREFVLAHQMIADTLVQTGWHDPARIFLHACEALPHIDPSDEWAVTLEGYIRRAETLLRGDGRTLN